MHGLLPVQVLTKTKNVVKISSHCCEQRVSYAYAFQSLKDSSRRQLIALNPPPAALLNLYSSSQNEDIDIALDNCTGVAFAETVNVYLKSQGRDEGKVAVIEVRSYLPRSFLAVRSDG